VTGSLSVALGLAWGALAALPLIRRARRATGASRLGDLRDSAAPEPAHHASRLGRLVTARLGRVGRVVSGLRARRVRRRVDAAIGREMPVTIDLLGVAVGAGCTPYLAVEVAARWSPPNLGARLDVVRRRCDLGAGFAEALDGAADEVPSLRPLADALLASDRYGAPVGDALSRLAADERTALRRRAEARARTVPVRMLFPLVFLVLPAFGLLTVAPTLLTGFAGP